MYDGCSKELELVNMWGFELGYSMGRMELHASVALRLEEYMIQDSENSDVLGKKSPFQQLASTTINLPLEQCPTPLSALTPFPSLPCPAL